MDCLVCRIIGVDMQWAYHVQCALNLGHLSIPKLQWKLAVGCGKGTDEMRLESLNGVLGGIDTVVVGFYQK